LGDCLLWAFFKNTEEAHILGLLFHHRKSEVLILTQKIGWATFWVIFSQTHPVTLKVGAFSGRR
jgi:hypothetical protein